MQQPVGDDLFVSDNLLATTCKRPQTIGALGLGALGPGALGIYICLIFVNMIVFVFLKMISFLI